ncbi:hypothetical protein D9M73_246590 [compost metagenome]
MCGEAEQRRHIGRIKTPAPLHIAYQPCDRAGNVIGVCITIETQAQGVLQYTDGLRLVSVQILHLAPVLAVAHWAIGPSSFEQTIVAVGLLKRQGK